ncbi:hypothetical protein LC612_33035 [Nostoc sp. CHAB 5834]|nr:hypothetical protein [Nostoc sp. CHAB 5834]
MAALLECAQHEVDALMATRLQEAQLAHERTDGLHVAQWLQPHLKELSVRPELDQQEELVLKAFREARAAAVPGAEFGQFSEKSVGALEALMREWWSAEAAAMSLQEPPSPPESDTEGQKARFLSAARRNLEERRAPNTPEARHKQLHNLRKVLANRLT